MGEEGKTHRRIGSTDSVPSGPHRKIFFVIFLFVSGQNPAAEQVVQEDWRNRFLQVSFYSTISINVNRNWSIVTIGKYQILLDSCNERLQILLLSKAMSRSLLSVLTCQKSPCTPCTTPRPTYHSSPSGFVNIPGIAPPCNSSFASTSE